MNVSKNFFHMVSNECAPRRRSIPVAQVEQMIENEVRKVKAERTIYDDRLSIMVELAENENHIEQLEASLQHARLRNKTLRADVNRINAAIVRRLELDEE